MSSRLRVGFNLPHRASALSGSQLSLISDSPAGSSSLTSASAVPAVITGGLKDDVSDFADLRAWFHANRDSLPRYTILLFFFVISLVQTWYQTKLYLSYPTGVNVMVDEPSSLREALPGVTVCHNGRFLKSKLQGELDAWLVKESDNGRHYDNVTEYGRQLMITKFLSAPENDETFGVWSSIDRNFDYTITADMFIQYLKCDQAWLSEKDQFKECENIPIFETLQYSGRCFTLFHELAAEKVGQESGIIRKNKLARNPKTTIDDFVIKDSAVTTDNDEKNVNQEKSRSNETAIDKSRAFDFDASEIIQMMLHFAPDEVTDAEYTGGKIYVHDMAHIPGMQELYFDLEPGYYYELYIRRVTTKQLPKPYSTNCTDHREQAFERIRKDATLGYPMTQVECINHCLAQHSVDECAGIWPPESVYFEKNVHQNRTFVNRHFRKRHQLRWGRWRAVQLRSGDSHMYYQCVALRKPECMRIAASIARNYHPFPSSPSS